MGDSEDIYSDVDSDGFVQDMRSYGVAQALPLEDEGIDDDAAAYLRAVREEASLIPHVTASVRRHGEPEPPVHQDPHGPLVTQPPPMLYWIHSVVDGFVKARQQVHHQAEYGRPHTLNEAPTLFDQPVPGPNDRRAWQRRMQDTSFQPYADTLSKMDNNLAASCLCSLVDEVANLCTPPPAPTQGIAGLSAAASRSDVGDPLPPHLAIWLYGLMVRLEQPVTPEVAAALRRIVTVAEAGLERCKQRVASPSQNSNGSYSDCGGVAEDWGKMQEYAGSSNHAALSPVNQIVCDSYSQAVCNEGNVGDGDERMDDDAGAAAMGDVSSGACGASPSFAHRPVTDGAGDLDESRLLDAGGLVLESSCDSPGGVGVQADGGAVQEVARCDTLRVLAGGFFGQDSTLAPLVHDYIRSAQVL